VGVGAGQAQPNFRAQGEPKRRPDFGSTTDWEGYLRQLMHEDPAGAEELVEQARVLALSMVVVSYNIPTQPIGPVVSTDVGWKWQSNCWSLPQPSLPPPSKGDPPVKDVPEPASVVSGLIGLCLTGAFAWRRRRLRKSA